MKRRNNIDELSSYVDALRPIIFIRSYDFHVIDEYISAVAGNIQGKGNKIIEYNNALGVVDFRTKRQIYQCGLEEFFQRHYDEGARQDTFFVLKDINHELNNPVIISYLKRISDFMLYNEDYYATIFIISDSVVIPRELESYITIFELQLPDKSEIEEIIKDFISDYALDVADDIIGDLAISFKGMNEFQIQQILRLAYLNGGTIDKDDQKLVLKEKEQFVKKSGMLEIINYDTKIDDIGGLDNLKEWLNRKEKIFAKLNQAMEFGVDIPKGIMIIGMPGCGKSLSAKATASLFNVPLVRLDIGRLLGKYVGESESNMRTALDLSEAISPCVLWIDEIEKAFSGARGNGSGNEVTTRLFGHFLTWMQEKRNTVFIVATANDISGIPVEFMRKGRFDELFFVDLPNENEKKNIFEIHLKKRKKYNRSIDLDAIVKKTEGYSGADIEAVVKEAIENAFIKTVDDGQENIQLSTADIKAVMDNTKSISDTLGDKIREIRDAVKKMDIKPASK